MLNRDNLFRAPKAETKASKTNSIAIGIIEAEGIARAEKTRRLRAARAERDACEKIQIAAIPEKSSHRKRSPKSMGT